MPAVAFHILSESGDEVRHRYACQLAEQAYDQGVAAFIRTVDAAEARRLDDLLWTFSDRAFIPHEIVMEQSPSHPRIAVLIGPNVAPESYRALLINLAADAPADFDRYARIVEVVDADAEHKRLARERYKQYRDRGYALETVNR